MRRLLALAAIATAGVFAAIALASSASTFDFQGAFNGAQPGATIIVPDGSYPSVTLGGTAKSGPVTFQAQDAGQVCVSSLTINVDRVHTAGIIACGSGDSRGDLDVCASSSACGTVPFTDVVIDGFAGKSAFIRASGVTVKYSEFGGVGNICTSTSDLATEDAFRFWGGSGANATPTNDTLEYSYIHDWHAGNNGTCDGTVTPTPHADCVQNQGGQNIVIKGNVFTACPSSDIQMAPFSGSSIGNVFIEGNYLGGTACCNRVVLGTGGASNATVCATLHVTDNVLFGTGVNTDGCAQGTEDFSGNTLCSSTSQTGCEVPAPITGGPLPTPPPTTTDPGTTTDTTPTDTTTTTTTTATTTTDTTTTTPPPPSCVPDGGYASCADEITALAQQVAQLVAQTQTLQTELTQAQGDAASLQTKLTAAQAQATADEARIAQALAALGG